MSSELSLSQMLASLEAQIKLLREREAHHAERGAHHQEQQSQAASELAAVLQSYEALKSAATTAAELTARLAPPPPPAPPTGEPPRELPPGGTKLRGTLVKQLLESLPKGELFGPARIAQELNRRYGRALARSADSRFTSSALRRLFADGRLELVQKGTPHHEAMYRKV